MELSGARDVTFAPPTAMLDEPSVTRVSISAFFFAFFSDLPPPDALAVPSVLPVVLWEAVSP